MIILNLNNTFKYNANLLIVTFQNQIKIVKPETSISYQQHWTPSLHHSSNVAWLPMSLNRVMAVKGKKIVQNIVNWLYHNAQALSCCTRLCCNVYSFPVNVWLLSTELYVYEVVCFMFVVYFFFILNVYKVLVKKVFVYFKVKLL